MEMRTLKSVRVCLEVMEEMIQGGHLGDVRAWNLMVRWIGLESLEWESGTRDMDITII